MLLLTVESQKFTYLVFMRREMIMVLITIHKELLMWPLNAKENL